MLKVVAYWYDRRHDQNGTIDNVDLGVQFGNITFWSNSAGTEKERVFVNLSQMGPTNVTIKLFGTDVTTDNEGCGINSARVYLGWYYEDTARNDVDGPGPEILPF